MPSDYRIETELVTIDIDDYGSSTVIVIRANGQDERIRLGNIETSDTEMQFTFEGKWS